MKQDKHGDTHHFDIGTYQFACVYDEDFNLLSTDKLVRDIRDFKYLEMRFDHRGRGGYLLRMYWDNYLGFRNGPVPGTGVRGRFSNAYRHPKTTQERRANQGYEGYVRGRRTGYNLPSSWDDVGRSNWHSKSWKNQKVRKQWQKRQR